MQDWKETEVVELEEAGLTSVAGGLNNALDPDG